VIWLHCVSVGETNAARPLVDRIIRQHRGHRLIVSTTTKTGQELAQKLFAGKADAVFYFPFDWKFSVRKALANYKPAVVLLMETEIWPRLIREAKRSGATLAIVNGRLSERSAGRYSLVRPFIGRVLSNIGLALMQGENDARRIVSLGLDKARVMVTGNLKFDLELNESDTGVTTELDQRFDLSSPDRIVRPLVVAASTHEPEERWVLDAFCAAAAGESTVKPRLMIAPRHPERFNAVAKLAADFSRDPACEWPGYTTARRSGPPLPADRDADVIILDSIGELRAVYPLAEIVVVGGSLIPHGGQSVLEPAAAGKAIITGHHTRNFEDAVRTFVGSQALIQLPDKTGEQIVDELFLAIADLLENGEERRTLGLNAAAVMKANRGATELTVEALGGLFR
jgi:3-deoxy-D-manno-octulosonic-acid transferase